MKVSSFIIFTKVIREVIPVKERIQTQTWSRERSNQQRNLEAEKNNRE